MLSGPHRDPARRGGLLQGRRLHLSAHGVWGVEIVCVCVFEPGNPTNLNLHPQVNPADFMLDVVQQKHTKRLKALGAAGHLHNKIDDLRMLRIHSMFFRDV